MRKPECPERGRGAEDVEMEALGGEPRGPIGVGRGAPQ